MKNLLLLLFTTCLMQGAHAQTVQVSPTAGGGFESGATFTLNGWTVVNGSYNNFYTGSVPVPSDGSSCAYSGSNSSTWTGTANLSVNHIYRDIPFGTESKLDISFKYKLSVADAGYDQLKVFLVPVTTTPVAGIQLSSGQIGVIYETATAWTTISLTGISASGMGGSARLVFSWKCDGYTPTSALALDYISVVSSPPPPPLSGTYTIDPAGTGTNNFTTFSEAITTLNAGGVGTGGVTFQVAAGSEFIEDPPAITATGTIDSPVIFERSGSGSNPVVRPTGSSLSQEGAFKLIGSDYITFDGIDILINTGYALEYGFYFVGQNNSNGCQNNTVKNCSVSLNATNTSSYGIYTYSYGTSVPGTNSNNRFYNNTITNCYNGISIGGSSNTYDTGNEVGTEGGGSNTILLPASTANTTRNGVTYSYQTGLKIFGSSIGMDSGGTWGSAYGIYSFIGSSTVSIYDNDIHGFKALFNGYFAAGIYLTSGTSHNIQGNSIHGIANTYASVTSSGSSAYGIYITTGTTISVSRNRIFDIQYAGPSAHSANGIFISYGATVSVFNNMVYDIKAPLSTSASAGACGIYLGGGTTVTAFSNSVLLNYDAMGSGANRSAALYFTSSPTSVDLRNNILVNNTNLSGNSNGASRAFALLRNASSLTNFAATSDYNLYYAGIPGSKNLIYHDGVNSDQTLATYKSRVSPRDPHAVTENPPFILVASPYDLHLDPAVPTQCESGGTRIITPYPVTNDLDGDTRQGEPGYAGSGTAPDLGADEYEGTSVDIEPPVITYTPLGNTSSTGNRNLSATITDPKTGVGSGANQPVLYWKVNSQPYGSPIAPSSVNGNQYTFSFGAGVAAGDAVAYFIVAQDNASTPNVGSFPAGAACTYNPPMASSGPPAPSTYVITGSLCGTKTVGAGGDYPTLTSAISDLNSKELCGPLELVLTDPAYDVSETFPLTINHNTGSGPANTITIRPATGTSPVITCSMANSVFILNGSDYVIFEGSDQPAGTTRNLVIGNNYTGGTNNYVISFTGNGSRGATNTIIRNCILRGTPTVSASYPIFCTNTGGGHHNTQILNNKIHHAMKGILFGGINGNGAENLQVTGNQVGDEAEPLKAGGITLSYCNNALINGNEIFGETAGNMNYGQAGISIGTGATNTKIRGNRIHDFFYNGTGGWGCTGISFAGDATSVTEISNNLIYNIKADGWNTGITFNPTGIVVSSGGNIRIWFNTIHLSGDVLSGTFNSFSAGMAIGSGVTLLDIRNNIVRNSMNQGVAGSSVNKTYGIYCQSAGTAFTQINYNDYFIDGTNGNTGYLGSDQSTLAAWQSVTGQEGASLEINPQFTSLTDLTPTNIALNGTGIAIAGVTTDFNNATRQDPPDMGAIEFGPVVPVNLTVGNVTVSDGQSPCYNATQTITVAGNGTFFEVLSGGSATFIAGQNIIFLPGTRVINGGTMVGKITATGNYCDNPQDLPAVPQAKPIASNGLVEEFSVSVYPNPTTGLLTVEIPGRRGSGSVVVSVTNMQGSSVLVKEFTGIDRLSVSLEGWPSGMYIIRVSTGDERAFSRIVKL